MWWTALGLTIPAVHVHAGAWAVAAEATTGTIVGTVADSDGKPLARAKIAVASPSGHATTATDARGSFLFLGLPADTYTISVEAAGFETATQEGITVLPSAERQVTFHLGKALHIIGRVASRSDAFVAGATTDSFTVSGGAARALGPPPASPSGLANYATGTVQGAIASVPGVMLDAFANAVVRGGKVDDVAFSYDSVPVPQGLIVQPGGNVVGAQLPTTGISSTNISLSGYETQGDNALSGVVDQIPATGTYPAHATLTLAEGIAGAQYQLADLELRAASPDQRWRYALGSTAGNEYFPYGDGSTFYPAEAGTYGLALQTRGQYSIESNVHYRTKSGDDLSVLGLVGEATYDQYGTPFAGETWGAFNGERTTFPGEIAPNVPVTFASRIRGTYDVLKTQWLHVVENSLLRLQVYQSQFGSLAGGPYWDDDAYPDGAISLSARQGGRETGIGVDEDSVVGTRHHIRLGAEYRVNTSFLDEVVPTADETITSNPTLHSYLAYAGDTWTASTRLSLMAALRLTGTSVLPHAGTAYSVGALDPHISLSYRLGGSLSLRATYDHTSVAPKALEVDRTDSANVDGHGNPAPPVLLAPEVANDFTTSIEGAGAVNFRLTYFDDVEKNRIDVLPFNFRSTVAAGLTPSGLGVPTNAGMLHARGVELWMRSGGLMLNANYVRAYSSSASQFAYNDLNQPAIVAGHLFPASYTPDFASTASYEFRLRGGHVRIVPTVSYETGFPYGNGTMAWVFSKSGDRPLQVLNDNYVDPGANYYFLRNPSRPYQAATNPYIGTLGTPEGPDPNTLRSMPQMLFNLHIEAGLTRRVTAMLDVANLFATASPTAYQANPYLIGPPGYLGGNELYSVAYAAHAGFSHPYVLGNGVPTNDGVHRALPWAYGTGGYVPQSYPNARTIRLALRMRT